MKTKLIITILLLLFLHSVVEAQSKKKAVYIDNKWLQKECKIHPLNILHVIAYNSVDSLKNYKKEKGTKYYISMKSDLMNELFRNSTLHSNAHFDCHGFPYWVYYSGGKSIYTIDLLRLMRYYNSPDTTYIRSKVSGNFSVADRRQLDHPEQYGRYGQAIDTTILGR